MEPVRSFIPTVITPRDGAYDIYSRLLKERIIFLSDEIDTDSANVIIAQMLHLEAENPERPIWLYINSPGGYVTAGLAILDTMKYIKPQVNTVCIGHACSAAALILACGDKRISLPNAEIMIHQPLGGARGQATDIIIQAEQMEKIKKRLEKILAEATGRSVKEIHAACERDKYLTPEEAKEFGLIDEIFSHGKPIGKVKKDE